MNDIMVGAHDRCQKTVAAALAMAKSDHRGEGGEVDCNVDEDMELEEP